MRSAEEYLEEIDRLRAELADVQRYRQIENDSVRKLRAALERAVKFVRLGNHPNAGSLLEQIEVALNEETK